MLYKFTELENFQFVSDLLVDGMLHYGNDYKEVKMLSDFLPVHKRKYNHTYPCKISQCPFVASSKRILRGHESKFHGQPYCYKYNCAVCSFKTDDRFYLKAHVSSVHKGEKKFPCQLCDYRATQSGSLKKHLRSIHAEGRNYLKCQKCQFRSEDRSALDNHVRAKHLDERPFVCDTCHQKFKRNPDMLKHKSAVHLKERPFRCLLCDFRTSHRNSLKLHTSSVHARLKPHKCHLCTDKSYSYINSLKNHLKTCHFNIITKFHCSHCIFVTRQKHYLKKHILTVHKVLFT